MLNQRFNRVERLFEEATGGECTVCYGGAMITNVIEIHPGGQRVIRPKPSIDQKGNCRACGHAPRRRIILRGAA